MAEPNATGATSGLTDNAAGAIAYLTIVPAIIFLLIEPYNKTHSFGSTRSNVSFCARPRSSSILGLAFCSPLPD